MSSTITILNDDDLEALKQRIKMRRELSSDDGYAVWSKYDKAIREVLLKYGKVGSEEDVDFYHGEDWFHELFNGFALRNAHAISLQTLHNLKKVVAQHNPDAMLSFGGEMGTLMEGLEILVTSTGVYAAWYNCTAAICEQKIKKAEIPIL
jgi:hypothetical protein